MDLKFEVVFLYIKHRNAANYVTWSKGKRPKEQ